MNNIILIGFMGVGKGTTARALSALTGHFAVDTDDLIESLVKKKIRAIFAEQGEAAFREMENRVALWIESCLSGTIISTGGGFFQVERMPYLGTIVYLHAEVEQIFERIMAHPKAEKKIKKRPLLSDLDKARALFQERLPRYRGLADFEVNVAGKATDLVAEEIRQLVY